MAVFTGINLSGNTTEDIVDAITALNRSLEYQMTNLDDDNIRELDYSKMVGGPPANADNTGEILTVDGSNFTIVNGAYVYSGPANYSQISGGPPTNADNTGLNLPASLGINFTKIGVNYIYTGTLSANQINAGTLNANYINGGTLNGIVFHAAQPSNPNNYLEIVPSSLSDGVPSIDFWDKGISTTLPRGSLYITHLSSNGSDYLTMWGPSGIQLTSQDIWMNGPVRFQSSADFSGATVTGLNLTAKFG